VNILSFFALHPEGQFDAICFSCVH